HHRQRPEERQDLLPPPPPRRHLRHPLAVMGVRASFVEEPRQLGLHAAAGGSLQGVEVVVAEDGLRPPFADAVAHPLDDRRAVLAAVAEVTEEDESPPLWVSAYLVVAECAAKRVQRPDFAVNVADDVDRSVEQLSHQAKVTHEPPHGLAPGAGIPWPTTG